MNSSWNLIFCLRPESISITHAGKVWGGAEVLQTHTPTQSLCESETKSVAQISSCQRVIGSLKRLCCGSHPTLCILIYNYKNRKYSRIRRECISTRTPLHTHTHTSTPHTGSNTNTALSKFNKQQRRRQFEHLFSF